MLHESIAKAPPIRAERLIGGCAHYGIGVGFAALLLAIFDLHARPSKRATQHDSRP